MKQITPEEVEKRLRAWAPGVEARGAQEKIPRVGWTGDYGLDAVGSMRPTEKLKGRV